MCRRLGAAIEMTHSRLEKSVANFRKAVELNPRNEPAFFSLIHLLGRICDWREYDALMLKARRFIDAGSAGGLGASVRNMCVSAPGRKNARDGYYSRGGG
jgi:hypothetical protein